MKLLQRLKNLFLPEGQISDGFHTFDELYHYRMLYNAAFFNSLEGKYEVHKSYRLVDVDVYDKWKLHSIVDIISKCRGNEEDRVKLVVPTLHGYHLITSKFDVEQCQQELALNGFDALDIHRDSPTLLYYHEPRIVNY